MDPFTLLPRLAVFLFGIQAAASNDIVASFIIFTLGALVGCITIVVADRRAERRPPRR